MKLLSDAVSISLLITVIFFSEISQAEEAFHDRIQGDVGGAVYRSNNLVRGENSTLIAVPYLYFDYGRYFARFDTFGYKTLPLGYGYVEVVGRVNLDGFQTNNPIMHGISQRKNSLPLGIGTFQETPLGGFFLNAFYDANQSHGSLYELIYAAELNIGDNVFYPLIGFEHFSARYTRYFYGVSPAEAGSSIYPVYTPSANNTTMLGFVWEMPVAEDWYADISMRRKWLGSSISQSPLVNTKLRDEAFISLSYRYQ